MTSDAMTFKTTIPAGRLFRSACVAAALAAAPFAAAPVAAASFDGHWSVLIITQRGDCDTAYRYEVNVTGGRVVYAGEGDFTVNGSVSGSGAVRVSIVRGSQSAQGGGKLQGTAGAGSWSGKSSTAVCSGRWEASKR
ncbi:MAG: hypothetical protein EPO23_13755 [Xanthobacteraceae bacterium]|nr:MAG: hypothetical protein EPO23_13755 [Xanthobacteraceae bacterium]